MVLKISPDRQNKALRPQPVGRASRPKACIFKAGGTLNKNDPQIVPGRSHSPAFGQSHAAVRPDRP